MSELSGLLCLPHSRRMLFSDNSRARWSLSPLVMSGYFVGDEGLGGGATFSALSLKLPP